MNQEIVKHYSNGEVKVRWEPAKCIHSGICFKGLPKVFDPRRKPWVIMENADSAAIMKQVTACPSGALSYTLESEDSQIKEVEVERIVEVSPNGPLLVYGNIQIKMNNGTENRQSKVTAFCRCGQSQNKPFCDGAHRKVDFQG